MLNRRELIRNGLAASVLTGIPAVAAVAAASRPSLWIVDTNLRGASEFSAVNAPGPFSLHSFASDPGSLWMQVIEPALRQGPVRMAGFTSAPTLFCLQYLARDYGLTLAGHGKGAAEPEDFNNKQQSLVDLQDPRYSDPAAGYTWLLAPKRG